MLMPGLVWECAPARRGRERAPRLKGRREGVDGGRGISRSNLGLLGGGVGWRA